MGLTPTRSLLRRRPLAWAGGHLLRVLLAALISCGITSAASAAVFVTTAPAAISLIIEPISLLLLPGILTAMALANAAKPVHHLSKSKPATHDFTPQAVVVGALIFYFVFFLIALNWYARRRRATLLLTSSSASG